MFNCGSGGMGAGLLLVMLALVPSVVTARALQARSTSAQTRDQQEV